MDNPMFDEVDQPGLADLVENGLDVAIKHPVDAPPTDPERECIQRLVLTTLRSEPVAEPQELRLVDRRQDRNHRRLDDLIFQCSNADRPLSAICLWNISPARWQRSIRSRLDARVEVREILLKAFRVSVQVISSTPGAPGQLSQPGPSMVGFAVSSSLL